MNLEQFVREALSTANRSLQKLESHERVCSERYVNIEERLKDHKERTDGIMKILWTTMFGVVGSLLAAVGSLIMLLLKH